MIPAADVKVNHVPLNPLIGEQQDAQPSFIRRTADSLVRGAVGGYAIYWITKLLDKYNIISTPEALHPASFVLMFVGVEGTGKVLESISIIANKIVGKREDANKELPRHSTRTKQLRAYSWKVIGKCEAGVAKVDCFASKLLRIRTSERIKTKKIQDVNLRFFEILRKCLIEQVSDSFTQEVSIRGGLTLASAAGFVFPGAQLMTSFIALSFFIGLQTKMAKIYEVKLEAYEKKLKLEMLIKNAKPMQEHKKTKINRAKAVENADVKPLEAYKKPVTKCRKPIKNARWFR